MTMLVKNVLFGMLNLRDSERSGCYTTRQRKNLNLVVRKPSLSPAYMPETQSSKRSQKFSAVLSYSISCCAHAVHTVSLPPHQVHGIQRLSCDHNFSSSARLECHSWGCVGSPERMIKCTHTLELSYSTSCYPSASGLAKAGEVLYAIGSGADEAGAWHVLLHYTFCITRHPLANRILCNELHICGRNRIYQ